MNEIYRENEVIGEVRAPLEHDTHAESQRTETKKENAPINRMERLFEKRELLKEKHAKSIENEKSAANRTKVIEAQMAKVNKEIHADEVNRMDKFSAEINMTYDEIMALVRDTLKNI